MEKYLLGKTDFFKEYFKTRIVVNETINRSNIVIKVVKRFLLFKKKIMENKSKSFIFICGKQIKHIHFYLWKQIKQIHFYFV